MIHPRINPRVSTPSTLNDETRDALAAGLALALAADAPNVIRLLQDFAADSVKAACPGPMGGASPASRLRDTGSRAASFGVSMMLAETYRSGSKHHLRAQARELQAELDRVHANLDNAEAARRQLAEITKARWNAWVAKHSSDSDEDAAMMDDAITAIQKRRHHDVGACADVLDDQGDVGGKEDSPAAPGQPRRPRRLQPGRSRRRRPRGVGSRLGADHRRGVVKMNFSIEELASAFGVRVDVAAAVVSDLGQPLPPLGLLERVAETLADAGARHIGGVVDSLGALWIDRGHRATIVFHDNAFKLLRVIAGRILCTQRMDEFEVLTERTLTTYFAQPLADLERQLAELEAERDELRSRVAILEADLRDAAREAP